MTSEGGPGSLIPCLFIALTRNLYSLLGDRLLTRYVVCYIKHMTHCCKLLNDMFHETVSSHYQICDMIVLSSVCL